MRMVGSMTYGRFHWIYNVPLIVLLAGLAQVWDRSWDWWWPALVVLGIVYAFTIPWDNYAAYRGIWGFPRERFSKQIGWLPLEEYLFFGLQSVQAILLSQLFLGLWHGLPSGEAVVAWPNLAGCGGILFGWVMVGWVGKRIGSRSRWHYAWHLLFWFLPIFGLIAVIASSVVAPLWPVWLMTTLVLGTYLTVADLHAISLGIWHFDARQISGFRFFGVLPWEEAAFFYLTSALVSWSYLVLLPGALR